jgi:tRNA dimethylallyltransferase
MVGKAPGEAAEKKGSGVSRRVPVIVGPTASGKTGVALRLAEILGGEIISADSRQIYRFLDVGTAKPTPAQRELVRHHFIDELDPDEEFNAGKFGELGRRAVDQIFTRGRLPIVAGGSGLYVRSLIDGLFEGPGADPEFRYALEERIKRGGLPDLMEELRRLDPETASRIDPTKPRRVVRALEVIHATGRSLSSHHALPKIELDFVPVLFGLLWERKELYRRIDSRCDRMVSGGLLEEAASLERGGYNLSLNALNTVGYKEAFALLRGDLTAGEMIAEFRKNTRRYAKRQMTWFRRDGRIRWIRMDEQTAEGDVAGGIAGELCAPSARDAG